MVNNIPSTTTGADWFYQTLRVHMKTTTRAVRQVRPPSPGGEYVSRIAGMRTSGNAAIANGMKVGDILLLRREPENQHDLNAVAVHTMMGQRLGYVPKDIAAEIASTLDLHLTPVEAQVEELAPYKTKAGIKNLIIRFRLSRAENQGDEDFNDGNMETEEDRL